MKDLHFKVDGIHLTKEVWDDFYGIPRGTKGLLRCMFNSDDEWTGTKTIARFASSVKPDVSITQDVPVTHVSCIVPDAVTDLPYFYVRLIGKKGNTMILTNWVIIEQER